MLRAVACHWSQSGIKPVLINRDHTRRRQAYNGDKISAGVWCDFKTLTREQNGRHFTYENFNRILLYGWISTKILLTRFRDDKWLLSLVVVWLRVGKTAQLAPMATKRHQASIPNMTSNRWGSWWPFLIFLLRQWNIDIHICRLQSEANTASVDDISVQFREIWLTLCPKDCAI